MELYPSTFPAPRRDPYGWTVDMGVLRTPMEGGLSRQRRLYAVMPTQWALEFQLPTALLDQWQAWVNANAYDYFGLPLISRLSSAAGTQTSQHTVRFTSNLEFELVAVDTVRVTVSAELAPTDFVPA